LTCHNYVDINVFVKGTGAAKLALVEEKHGSGRRYDWNIRKISNSARRNAGT
jgi:hypothetical protein